MSSKLPENIRVINEGEADGQNWVFKITSMSGREVMAIAVSPANSSRTGPTWSYVFESEGLTTVDLGTPDSLNNLAKSYEYAGISINEIDRLIITHGHSDHDGTVPEFLAQSGARFYAHESYSALKTFDQWDIQDRASTPLQIELGRLGREKIDSDVYKDRYELHKEYYEARKTTVVDTNLVDGASIPGATILSTPGHSPDQICVKIDNLLLTGDHVLPEITPHPTSKMVFREKISNSPLVKSLRAEDLYGLGTYIKSLGIVVALGSEVQLLPAHRFFNKGKLNLGGVERASDIVLHHQNRLERLHSHIGNGKCSLTELTTRLFDRSKLLGGNLMAALSEVVAHLELLEDVGDIEISSGGSITHTGSEPPQYLEFIKNQGVYS